MKTKNEDIIRKLFESKCSLSPEERAALNNYEYVNDTFHRQWEEMSEEAVDLVREEKILNGIMKKVRGRRFPFIKKSFYKYGMAAMIAVCMVLSALLLMKNSGEEIIYVVNTGYQSMDSVRLADGTKVMLNAGSRLTYPKEFSGEKREVQLSGQAFFEVTPDKTHPFVVKTQKMDVTVAGSDNMIQNGGDVVRYILKEGEAIGSYYGLETDGLYTQEEIDAGHYYKYGRKPNAGDIKYVPQRENVEWGDDITDDDRTIIGKDVPDFTYGININLQWKNFELSAFGQGVSGTSVAFESEQVFAFMLNSNPRKYHLSRWNEDNPNPNAACPRLYGGNYYDEYNKHFSDYQLFDADYFRIKTISLGYMVPKDAVTRWGLSSLKFFLTGENLFTFRADKDMKDFDPESSTGRGISAFGAKSVAFGVNVSF